LNEFERQKNKIDWLRKNTANKVSLWQIKCLILYLFNQAGAKANYQNLTFSLAMILGRPIGAAIAANY
jgi:hypothetical protein